MKYHVKIGIGDATGEHAERIVRLAMKHLNPEVKENITKYSAVPGTDEVEITAILG